MPQAHDPVIASAANPVARRVRLLADRRHRRREGAFVVQGIQPVWQAVEAGADIEALIVAPGLLRSPAAREMVRSQGERGTRVISLTSELFTRLASRDGPAGLAAIVRARPARLDALPVPADALFVALHAPGNPGNVGTVIRTASAAGAAGVIVTGAAADPYDPVAVKASMGALFDVPVAVEPDAAALADWAARHQVTVAAATGHGERSLWAGEFPLPLVILLGSEAEGLPDGLLDAAALRVRIPMTGTAESLNLAVAAGVLLYEVRRRTGLPGRSG